MNRTRTLAPLLGLMALAATLSPPAPAHAQIVTVTDLTPTDLNGFNAAYAFGISGGVEVGQNYGADSNYRAYLWKGTLASAVDLNPAGFSSSVANGIDGTTQVGTGGYGHALLWHGTASSAIDLNPTALPGIYNSFGTAVSGNTEVGYGYGSSNQNTHALLWHGTAASAIDLSPAGSTYSVADGVYGDAQVGFAIYGGATHALLWHGTADSAVSLTPTNLAGYIGSFANGIDSDSQVGSGYGTTNRYSPHALLWHGTADSAVDLNPHGFYTSTADAVFGGVQVGYGNPITTGYSNALLWTGTPGSVLDLSAYLPSNLYQAQALSVEVHGNVVDVVGAAPHNNADEVSALLWHIVFPSTPTVLHLDPASRTQGRDGFTLAVTGSSFKANSRITWNGTAQATTFVSPFEITADIPASLIAASGTAQVAVSTAGSLSNAHALVINPRPVLSALSPASIKAGSSAFTLSVTGTGFLSTSVIKWKGAAQTTHYVSATKLTATVSAALVKKAGKATVTVTTPDVATSAGQTFTITP